MKVYYDNEIDALYLKLGNEQPEEVIVSLLSFHKIYLIKL